MFQFELTDNLKGMSIQQYKTDVGFRTLVESLICGLPIPPIYTCRNEKNQLEILDGQQRIMSLFFYYIGYYLDNKKRSSINFSELELEECLFGEALMGQFALEELHICLSGKEGKTVNVDYAQLPLEIKRRVDYTAITIIEIKIENDKYRSKILRQIFANLNKGGSLLSSQEQRNGIYVCSFYDMLHDINRNNKEWRKIWGRKDAKERDMETLLRFCALRKYVSIKKQRLHALIL